jgi:hypothetical protein
MMPRLIKSTPNYRARTFTLRLYYNGELYKKLRTFKMSKEEFNSCLHNTNNDWNQFLKSDDYYLIKYYDQWGE